MPFSFSEEDKTRIKDQVIDWISEGQTLREFCRQEGMPTWSAIYRWQDEDDEFKQRFVRARDIGFDVIAEEALKIADTPVEGIEYEDGPMGSKQSRKDMLGHRKLQIETRLKLLAKWSPKKYGERIDHTSSDGSMSPKGKSLDDFYAESKPEESKGK